MILDPKVEWRKKHFNLPQIRSMIIRANTEVGVIARGVGKTEGIVAPRIAHNAFAMPRSLGGMVTPTFKKLFTELVPSIYAGLDGLGYVENKHYVIGQKNGGPPKWARPFKRVRDWSNAMHWCNGSGRVFISQDRPGMGNGLSLDDMIVDEGKLIDWDKYENTTAQTLRGNREHFEGFPEWHSLLITSDRPTTKKGKAFLKYGQGMDEEVINMILQSHFRMEWLEGKITGGELEPSSRERYQQEYNQLAQLSNQLRCKAIHYHEASILDNIDVYGWENLMKEEKRMSPLVFRTSMLNEDITFVEGSWYPFEDRHFYRGEATDFTIGKGYVREPTLDCRNDNEIASGLGLEISMDYGGRFNCLAVGQTFSDLLRIDRGFHATWPRRTQDVVMDFVKYYLPHPTKEVNYYFDDTAKDRHGTTEYNYHDIVIKTLQDNDWNVNPVYIGQTPAPKIRYEFTTKLLKKRSPPVMWNEDGASDMVTSMRLTHMRDGKNGIEKNKKDERGDLDDQVLAPHYADACDTLLWGVFEVMDTGSVVPSLFPR